MLPFCSLYLQCIGSILHISHPLCSAEECPTVPPRGALVNHTPSFRAAAVNQFLCSSCWIEMKLSVKLQNVSNRRTIEAAEGETLKCGEGGVSHHFPPSYRYFHNPKRPRKQIMNKDKTSICHLLRVFISPHLRFQFIFRNKKTKPTFPEAPN